MDVFSPGNSFNIQTFVNSISVDDLKDMFTSSTFYKGKSYYESGEVKSVKFEMGGEKMIASVQGSERYSVTVSFESGKIQQKCSCPLGGSCKHLVAALLYVVLEKDSIEVAQPRNNNSFIKTYLESLNREELVDLVCKYAPERFFNEISNMFSDSSESQAVFRKVEKTTMKLLSEIDYEDKPDDISSALGVQAAKLLGLEKHLKTELSGYIFSVIGKIDEIQGEGYLYDDYTDDCFECPEEFVNLVKAYVKSLSGNEKTPFLRKLDAILSDLGHTGFDELSNVTENVFDVNDLPDLKNYFIQNLSEFSSNLAEKYYGQLHKLMTDREKEMLLDYLKEDYPHRLIELSEQYLSTGRKSDSIKLIKKWAEGKNNRYNEKVYSHYIDLVKDDESQLEKVCIEAITNCPTNTMLLKIEKTIRGETAFVEKILEEKRASELLDYLEAKGRLQEAMALINRSKNLWADRILSFYRKHKMVFKTESIAFFSKMVKDNLQNAGDSYYNSIIDAIQQLQKLDPVLANKFVAEIRANYPRRRNLMSMLNRL